MELYNELTVLVICQLLLLASGSFIEDEWAQDKLGNVIIAITVTSFVINLVPIIYGVIKS